jgi:hypothetical protein
LEETEVRVSPSGRYSLQASLSSPEANQITLTVRRTQTQEVVYQDHLELKMPRIAWCEEHADGQSYLYIVREDESVTVLELETGRSVEGALTPHTFRPYTFLADPKQRRLFAAGYHAPLDLYAFLILDIHAPLSLPYPTLKTWDALFWLEDFIGFDADGSLRLQIKTDRRASDHALILNLSDQEQLAYQDTDTDENTIEVLCHAFIHADLSLSLEELHACYPRHAYLCDF